MTGVNQTLFIPLYGKAKVSRQGIIIKDSMAEKIWYAEAFAVQGKSKSKWLTYNMAMRAKIFDDWVEKMLVQNSEALVLHINLVLADTQFKCDAEHSLTPENLVKQLPAFDRGFFKFLFTGSFYRKIYRLYEISKTI